MKIVDFAKREMSRIQFEDLKTEQKVYTIIKGDYVVKAIFTFKHMNCVCFVLEYMIGGDF